jgi:hypothetical protein
MSTAKISIYCPPMPIHGAGIGKKITAAEPMVATITFNDGSTLVIQNVIIPPTPVKRTRLGQWLVAECDGEGIDADGNRIVISLPEEIVEFKNGVLTALAIPETGYLSLADGTLGVINDIEPDCPVDIFPLVASAVTATGTVEFAD